MDSGYGCILCLLDGCAADSFTYFVERMESEDRSVNPVCGDIDGDNVRGLSGTYHLPQDTLMRLYMDMFLMTCLKV